MMNNSHKVSEHASAACVERKTERRAAEDRRERNRERVRSANQNPLRRKTIVAGTAKIDF